MPETVEDRHGGIHKKARYDFCPLGIGDWFEEMKFMKTTR